MRKRLLLTLAVLPLLNVGSAQALELKDLKPQTYSSTSGGGTTETRGGTIDLNKSGSVYGYGQSQTFNSGSNPRNDNTTNSVGVGVRFK
jgi:hypothetical protein